MEKVKNSYISNMKKTKAAALEVCSKSVKNLFKKFFDKCIEAMIEQDDENIISNINFLLEATLYFAKNTWKEEIIEGENLQYIKLIISELESIYVKIINSNSHDKSDYYFNRINFITLIFDRNVNGIYLYHDGNVYRRGKAFESYKNL